MKRIILILLIVLLAVGIRAEIQDWVTGEPVQTDTTNYEWVIGEPFIFINGSISVAAPPPVVAGLNCTLPNDWSATHVINLSKPCNLNISGYVGTMHFVGSGYWNLTTNISVSHFCFAKNVTRGNITWMGNSSARLNINGTC